MPNQATRWVAVGRLQGAFGVHGEAKVLPLPLPIARLLPDPDPHWELKADWLLSQPTWWMGRTTPPDLTARIIASRMHDRAFLVRIAGYENREQLQTMAGMLVWWPDNRLPDPGKDRHFWVHLIGMQVLASQDDHPENGFKEIGVVEELLATGSNDVLVVCARDGTERLLPFIRDTILRVDAQEQQMHVRLMPGL
ncbi:MAG: 16S rRNA processing protein RimM [Magnetococcales bacterium]|nr:16S rRNA processing protein RimM [Magnetococcales bacterium]NGZ04921.1 16S rRNA processing protein RimM [Magnetococcales bacterium]